MYYYNCKVAFEVEINGKVKKQNRLYTVYAVSVTDAEAKVNEYLKSSTEPFEVLSSTKTPILDVIQ
jgi:type IV secretory pathway TrbF-like protein